MDPGALYPVIIYLSERKSLIQFYRPVQSISGEDLYNRLVTSKLHVLQFEANHRFAETLGPMNITF